MVTAILMVVTLSEQLRLGYDRMASAVCRSVGHKRSRSLLFVGHPRSGTGFAAALMRSWGLRVGHETVERDGTSCWYADCEGTPPDCRAIAWDTYAFQHTVHVIRRPRDTVASVAFTEMTTERYRNGHLGVGVTPDRISDAIRSISLWTDWIEEHFEVGFVFRVEDDPSALFEYVSGAVGADLSYVADLRRVNSRQGGYRHLDLDALLDDHAKELAELDRKLGYVT